MNRVCHKASPRGLAKLLESDGKYLQHLIYKACMLDAVSQAKGLQDSRLLDPKGNALEESVRAVSSHGVQLKFFLSVISGNGNNSVDISKQNFPYTVSIFLSGAG